MNEDERRNIEESEDDTAGESNAARRLRMLGVSTESSEEADAEIARPRGVRAFLENFWYHYKFATIAVVAAVAVIGVGVYQLLSRVTPDAYIMLSGPFFYENTEPVMSAFAEAMDEDYNGDGEKVVNILHTVRYNEEQIAALESMAEASGEKFEFDRSFNAQEYERFQNEIMVGESLICIMDSSLYAEVADSGVFMTIRDALGYVPEYAADDCALYFKETGLAKYYSIFNRLPDDTVIAIRSETAAQKLKGKKAAKSHKDHLKLFRNIVEFEEPIGD